MGDLLYLPYVFVIFLVVYIAVFILCFHLFDRKRYFNAFSRKQRMAEDGCTWTMCCLPSFAFPLLRVEAAYESVVGDFGNVILLLVRSAGFGYIGYFTTTRIRSQGLVYLQSFEVWSSVAAVLYFFFATLLSCCTAAYWLREVWDMSFQRAPLRQWSLSAERLAALVLGLRAIALTNCFFTVAMQLIFFDLHVGYDDNLFLAPAAAMLLDLVLSKLPHRLEHYYLAYTLLFAYLVTIWVLVHLERINWPYSELTAADARCYGRYFIILCVHFGLHAVSLLMALLRNRVAGVRSKEYIHAPEYASSGVVNTSHGDQYSFIGDDEKEGEEGDVELAVRFRDPAQARALAIANGTTSTGSEADTRIAMASEDSPRVQEAHVSLPSAPPSAL